MIFFYQAIGVRLITYMLRKWVYRNSSKSKKNARVNLASKQDDKSQTVTHNNKCVYFKLLANTKVQIYRYKYKICHSAEGGGSFNFQNDIWAKADVKRWW